MKILATCATGAIGALLVPALVDAGHEVALLTRNAKNADGYGPGVVAVEGDWTDPATLRRALEERDGLILIGNGERELFGNLFAIEAARRSASLHHVVYIGGQNPEGFSEIPTIAAKLVTEMALRDSGSPFTILRPSTFMQNDLKFREPICAGRYPGPFGDIGVARIDLVDVAAAAVTVIGAAPHLGQTYTLCGPQNLTGVQIADTWSTALDRAVAYTPVELDRLEEMAREFESAPMAHSIRMQFEHYQAGALLATADEIDRLSALLGRPPRTFADFCHDVAASWHLSQADVGAVDDA